MNLKNLYFSWLMYWNKAKGMLYGFSEGIILISALLSIFIFVYQFGLEQTADSVQTLEHLHPYILLGFFIGITIRYIVRFQEVVQEKMLYLDISIFTIILAEFCIRDLGRSISDNEHPKIENLPKDK